MDRFAKLAANYAQRNPEKLQAFGKQAMTYASDPRVQQAAMKYASDPRVHQAAMKYASNPRVQEAAMALGKQGFQSSPLEQRVAALEAAVYQQGGRKRKQKTRKQKRKHRTTRKH